MKSTYFHYTTSHFWNSIIFLYVKFMFNYFLQITSWRIKLRMQWISNLQTTLQVNAFWNVVNFVIIRERWYNGSSESQIWCYIFTIWSWNIYAYLKIVVMVSKTYLWITELTSIKGIKMYFVRQLSFLNGGFLHPLNEVHQLYSFRLVFNSR